jgi:hypothetical protein
MHQGIDNALRLLRQDPIARLDPNLILDACRQVGHRWRSCLLNPVAIFHWFTTQILKANTSLAHVSQLAERSFSDSAYCQARARLPLRVFQVVLRLVTKTLVGRTRKDGRWRGHRTLILDGSSFSMPDTPELQKKFGQPGNQRKGCGFPVAKILALFHAGTGLLLEIFAAPLRSHEMASVGGVHPVLESNDVLIGDRGLCSFFHLAILANRGIHAVFRAHQKQIVDFTPRRPYTRPVDKARSEGRPRSRWVRQLGVTDQVVEWFKPRKHPDWMSDQEYAELPESLLLRELRYEIRGAGSRTRFVTLVTTLLDADAYPLEALAQLYGSRWRVELHLRHLKQTMKMDTLKCKTSDGVLKELIVYALVYNLVRLVMCEAARRQSVVVERVSFVDAYRWLSAASPRDDLPKLIVNPHRPGRIEPRVRKRRPKQFPVMKKPRSELRKDLMNQQLAA